MQEESCQGTWPHNAPSEFVPNLPIFCIHPYSVIVFNIPSIARTFSYLVNTMASIAEDSFQPCTENAKLLKFHTTKKYIVTHQVDDLNALMRRYPNGAYFDADTLPDNYGLSLRLSPCGIQANENGCFGIFLHCGYVKDILDKCKATIKLLDDNGEQLGDHSTITMKYADNTTCGPNRKFKTEDMPNRFKIEFCVYKPTVWSTPNFAINVNNAFVKQFVEQIDCDVQLHLVSTDEEGNAENATLLCHSFVLKSQSPVFRKMLNGKWKEGGKEPIIIQGVQPEIMRIFLRILYGDRIEVDETFPNMVLHLLSLSTKYDVLHVGESLIGCIDQNLVVESSINTLQCATQWEADYPLLKPKVLSFIAKHIDRVFETDGYKALLAQNNVGLIHEILQAVAKQ